MIFYPLASYELKALPISNSRFCIRDYDCFVWICVSKSIRLRILYNGIYFFLITRSNDADIVTILNRNCKLRYVFVEINDTFDLALCPHRVKVSSKKKCAKEIMHDSNPIHFKALLIRTGGTEELLSTHQKGNRYDHHEQYRHEELRMLPYKCYSSRHQLCKRAHC